MLHLEQADSRSGHQRPGCSRQTDGFQSTTDVIVAGIRTRAIALLPRPIDSADVPVAWIACLSLDSPRNRVFSSLECVEPVDKGIVQSEMTSAFDNVALVPTERSQVRINGVGSRDVDMSLEPSLAVDFVDGHETIFIALPESLSFVEPVLLVLAEFEEYSKNIIYRIVGAECVPLT